MPPAPFRARQNFFVNELLMTTAADLAKAARGAPALPAAQALRHAREARGEFWPAFAVTFFVAVLGACLLAGAAVIFGTTRAQVSPDAAPPDDRIARVSRPLFDGISCRNMMIDNRTSRTIEDKVGPCERRRGKSDAPSRPEFVWGGK